MEFKEGTFKIKDDKIEICDFLYVMLCEKFKHKMCISIKMGDVEFFLRKTLFEKEFINLSAPEKILNEI